MNSPGKRLALAQLSPSIDCDTAHNCRENHHGSAMDKGRDGSLIRADEIAGQAEQVAVESCHLQVVQAERCNVVEDWAAEISVIGNSIRRAM
jgi:hypothetical protein